MRGDATLDSEGAESGIAFTGCFGDAGVLVAPVTVNLNRRPTSV